MAHLSIRTLGPLAVTLDEQPITGSAYDKVWALLVYLAMTAGRAHTRTALAGLLWPDQPEARARTNLRQALTRLRQTIGDATATPAFLVSERKSIEFDATSNYALDVLTFNNLLTACAAHTHRRDETCSACAERRERAVALYQGPFLDNFYAGDSDLFDEWATLTRESLHQRALHTLSALVVYHERRGNYDQALRYGERQLELDPWREEACRQIMRLLALTGQRSAALNQYERCRAMLEMELGVAPAAETTALYEQIRAERFHPLRDAPSHDQSTTPNIVSGTPATKPDYLARPTPRAYNLPLPPTPLIGRQAELAALAGLIANPHCRLITLLGPGGVGKSRLALQAATGEGEAFADGAAYVPLAPLNSAEFIAPAVATALQFRPDGHVPLQTQLLQHLRARELLLVLDNIEHLLQPPPPVENGHDPALELLAGILQQAPGVTLLVTSRARLNMQGEWVYDVGGLETPAVSVGVSEPEQDAANGRDASHVETYSAAALFLQTARRVQADFAPTPADHAAILRICQLVQGMPLALELAAAWVRVLSCAEIAQEIEASLSFLTTSLRDVPARHRSLQAVFDHSWKLLSLDEQHVLARCSIFRGGFTREAATEVAGATLPILAALVDKSLLRHHLNGRYEFHELARQYAAARLAELEPISDLRNRHLAYFMQFAESAEPLIRGGTQVMQWLDALEMEHDNLRAALEWSLTGGDFEPGFRIVGALWEFWMGRGYAREGQTHAERFLARPEGAADAYMRARALQTAGVLAFYQGRLAAANAMLTEVVEICRALGPRARFLLAMTLDGLSYIETADLQNPEAARAYSRESLSLGHELQDDWLRGHAFNQLGCLDWQRGDYASAHQLLLQAFQCFQADGHSVMRGPPLMRLATLLWEQGDYATAQTYLIQALTIFEELDDKVRISNALTHLGVLAMVQGQHDEAQQFLDKALTLARVSGHLSRLIETLDPMGRLAQRQGDYVTARALHEEMLDLCVETDRRSMIGPTLKAFACLAAREGEAEKAARLFGAAETRFAAGAARFDPTLRAEQDHLIAVVRAQLGENAFNTAWAAGAAMTREEAIALAKT